MLYRQRLDLELDLFTFFTLPSCCDALPSFIPSISRLTKPTPLPTAMPAPVMAAIPNKVAATVEKVDARRANIASCPAAMLVDEKTRSVPSPPGVRRRKKNVGYG
mmetsp:Transcript_7286/g.16602  ORF Transcript_7286/g.16602 Transcript_7286/m.16602 type:complete len:105 (+) Transcript_7286:1362-1676(+)